MRKHWHFRAGRRYVGVWNYLIFAELHLGDISPACNDCSRSVTRSGFTWALLPDRLMPGETGRLRGWLKVVDAGEFDSETKAPQ